MPKAASRSAKMEISRGSHLVRVERDRDSPLRGKRGATDLLSSDSRRSYTMVAGVGVETCLAAA